MRSLVTGGAGFIGSHLVDKLLEMGHQVTVVDNESSTCNQEFYWNDKAWNVRADISDAQVMEQVFSCVNEGMPKIDWVFHLAAYSRIQIALQNPVGCVRTNVLGTTTLLQNAREHGVKAFINSSTSSSYGLKNEPPLREDMTPDCLNPYSVSKVAAENICKMYSDLFDINTVSLRYFNVYGDRQPLVGQYAPVVGLFLEQWKKGEAFTIVGDGEQRRDFTHVDDVVKANIAAAERASDISGEIINVGTGTNHSVNQIADTICSCYTKNFIPPRPAEARVTLADISKAKKLLGYMPSIEISDWIDEYKVR
jgi:UDP-glucose 4-epimerase